jgi:hypothetical protein
MDVVRGPGGWGRGSRSRNTEGTGCNGRPCTEEIGHDHKDEDRALKTEGDYKDQRKDSHTRVRLMFHFPVRPTNIRSYVLWGPVLDVEHKDPPYVFRFVEKYKLRTSVLKSMYIS